MSSETESIPKIIYTVIVGVAILFPSSIILALKLNLCQKSILSIPAIIILVLLLIQFLYKKWRPGLLYLIIVFAILSVFYDYLVLVENEFVKKIENIICSPTISASTKTEQQNQYPESDTASNEPTITIIKHETIPLVPGSIIEESEIVPFHKPLSRNNNYVPKDVDLRSLGDYTYDDIINITTENGEELEFSPLGASFKCNVVSPSISKKLIFQFKHETKIYEIR